MMARFVRRLLELAQETLSQPAKSGVNSPQLILRGSKFERRRPTPQNDIDLFSGHWATNLSDVVTGTVSGPPEARFFTSDPRPSYAMAALGQNLAVGTSRVLELGPLEGAHTYQLERLGVGEIISIEANSEAFLKCLIVKNLVGLKNSRFLFGDFIEHLKMDTAAYDFIFCSGVLYHMADPLQLIELMAARTDRIFIWSHYYGGNNDPRFSPVEMRHGGDTFIYHKLHYGNRNFGRFWGGTAKTSCWLSRDDLFRAFAKYGFANVEVHHEDLLHQAGPCLSASFWRSSFKAHR